MTGTRNREGFTLVELMVASLLFALVVAGLAAIYATVFKQARRILVENRVKNQAAYAMKAVKMELAQATSAELPAAGTSGQHLSGCRGFKADGAPMVSTAGGFGAFDTGCFHFCVRTTPGGGTADTSCTSAGQDPPSERPAACLYYYPPGSGAWGGPPPPTVTDSTCGDTVGGVAPELLAFGLRQAPQAAGPDLPYFDKPDIAKTGNTIRMDFVVVKERDSARNEPEMTYQVGSSIEFEGAGD